MIRSISPSPAPTTNVLSDYKCTLLIDPGIVTYFIRGVIHSSLLFLRGVCAERNRWNE